MSSSHSSDSKSKLSILERFQEKNNDLEFDHDFNLGSTASANLSFSKFSHVSGISVSNPRSVDLVDMDLQKSESPFLKKMQMSLDMEVDHFPKLLQSAKSGFPQRPISAHESPFFSSSLQTRERHKEASSQDERHSAQNRQQRTNEKAPHAASAVKVSFTPAQRVEKHTGMKPKNALDNFKFFEKIGRGAYADVYRGINLKTNQVVAVKQITLDRDHDLGALMGEIDLLKILKHPNIVKYHGFVKTPTSLNVFLEYCAGGSLRQLYKRMGHGLPEAEIVSYVNPILKGLSYLHEQGVVHRDVKAANVLLTESGKVKLADFGVATKVTTLHSTVVGTPNWMAPETVLGGDGICTASDIWSLGATIIELFTMNPPYHDLNPMATLHAIGVDEHPPLPAGLSPIARDFLLECFQKQPNLRISAHMLLRHRWIQQKSSDKSSADTLQNISSVHSKVMKAIADQNEDENWEKEFVELKSNRQILPRVILPTELRLSNDEIPETKDIPKKNFSRMELLSKFSEGSDNLANEFEVGEQSLNLKLAPNHVQISPETDEHDPFLELDIENFDTNELEIQGKMEFLITKLANRVTSSHLENEEVTKSLVKITGRMHQLSKKYPSLHDVFIRDHGVLTMMELLDNSSDLIEQHKLWFHVLATLNVIFDNNIAQIENFSLLGGIPMITQFSKLSFGLPVRLQVVKFVKILRKSEKALLMFVSSGGLKILSRFLEEDFDFSPDFPLVAIHCIHEILSKDLTRFKSDMCRILSKYGIVFWFVVLLNRLTKYKQNDKSPISSSYIEETIDKILEVVKFFGQAEPRVRINISNPDLFKLLIMVYPSLSFPRQLALLKFFRSMSCVSELLKPLYSADILEFYVTILREYTPTTPHYKEVVNIACPSLYNCCYLNHNKEWEIVKLGAVPLLRDLSKLNLPFRQFVLPILCEFAYCDASVRKVLLKHDVVTTYLNLLLDPYWHSNAMDSILHWASEDPTFNWLDSTRAQNCLVSGFMMTQVSNLEAVLDNYLSLVSTNSVATRLMARDSTITSMLQKLKIHRNPAVTLSLLRILNYVLSYAKKTNIFPTLTIAGETKLAMSSIISQASSVLVREMAHNILAIFE